MTNPQRSMMQQDFHAEQCTVEIICSGFDDQTDPHQNAPIATGIYLLWKSQKFLVTNWHVVSGRNPETNKQIGDYIPRSLKIREIVREQNGRHPTRWIPLYSQDETPNWICSTKKVEVEGNQHLIDLAIIPLPYHTPLRGIDLIDLHGKYIARPLDQMTVIGFPYKRERPIWKTAHIAESVQPSQDYFLINGRTKSGMSGSGVFSTIVSVLGPSTSSPNGLLVGIYSGRYKDLETHDKDQTEKDHTDRFLNLDLGIVWKIDLIEMILKEAGH